jgi:type II secretory pathway pseudopilin PulG
MENTEQTPEYFWHEPTTSWKTQEEIAQYELEQQQELERQQQEAQQELERQQQEEAQAIYEYQLPRVYAHIGEDGSVLNTIVASREFMDTKPYGDAIYIENTDEIKNQPGRGGTYDETLNAFIAPKPYDSWILNEETCEWESPIPKPTT